MKIIEALVAITEKVKEKYYSDLYFRIVQDQLEIRVVHPINYKYSELISLTLEEEGIIFTIMNFPERYGKVLFKKGIR